MNCSRQKLTKEEQQQYEREKRKDPKLKHELLLRLKVKGLATIDELDKHLLHLDDPQERSPTDKGEKAPQLDVNTDKLSDLAGWLKAAATDLNAEGDLLQVEKDKCKEATKRLDIQTEEMFRAYSESISIPEFKRGKLKTFDRLMDAKTQICDLAASLDMQKAINEDFMRETMDLCTKLGKYTKMTHVRSGQKHFEAHLQTLRPACGSQPH
jgi:hypothetical protein